MTHLPQFTPDGTKLIGLSIGVRVWDLRLIRRQLAEMGLDWDAPSYLPADRVTTNAQLLKVEVSLGDPAQLAQSREKDTRLAIEQLRHVLKKTPDSANTCNNLAWLCLTAPEALRDVKAAVPLAENAVRLVPGNGMFVNTLGVAYYRAGRYREAIDVLRPNFDRHPDEALAFDLYFLAMSHHRLGETVRARDYFDWAVRWTGTQKGLSAGHVEELKMFRAEAEELMRIIKKQNRPPPGDQEGLNKHGQ